MAAAQTDQENHGDMEMRGMPKSKQERSASKAGEIGTKDRIDGAGLPQASGLAGQFQRPGLLRELGQAHVEKRSFEHMPRVCHLLRVGSLEGIGEAIKGVSDGLATKFIKFFDITHA